MIKTVFLCCRVLKSENNVPLVKSEDVLPSSYLPPGGICLYLWSLQLGPSGMSLLMFFFLSWLRVSMTVGLTCISNLNEHIDMHAHTGCEMHRVLIPFRVCSQS